MPLPWEGAKKLDARLEKRHAKPGGGQGGKTWFSVPRQSKTPSPRSLHAEVATQNYNCLQRGWNKSPVLTLLVSEGSLKPSKTRQGVIFRNNTQESCFLSPLTLELSRHWFTVTSAAIHAQTLLKPSNISQWVIGTFRPLQKTQEEIYICFPAEPWQKGSGTTGIGHGRHQPHIHKSFTAVKV